MDLCARVSTYRMATVQELVAVGEQIGLKGEELKAFIKEQQMLEREARMKEREAREREQELIREREKDAKEAREKELVKEDRERAFELEKLKLEHEIRVTELQAMKTGSQAGSEVGDDERTGSDTERSGYSGSRVRGPKMPPFDERDDMDSYIQRFERYAVTQKWRKEDCAIYLSALLKGKALDVYARLPVSQAQDYEVLKQALLRRYSLTEKRYKQKFYEGKPERGESPQQFIVRLDNYFLRWLELAKVEFTFEGVRNLIVKERFLATCHKPLELFLRERAVTDLEELAKLAEQYNDAHGPRPSGRAEAASGPLNVRRQNENWRPYAPQASRAPGPAKSPRQARAPGPVRPSGPSGSFGPYKSRCFACGQLGHVARNCLQRQHTGAMMQAGQKTGGTNQNIERPNIAAEGSIQGTASGSSMYGQMMRQPTCKSHGREWCTECINIPPGHVCNVMVNTEVKLKCGCIAPVLADACGQPS